jgi:hypothetical protein
VVPQLHYERDNAINAFWTQRLYDAKTQGPYDVRADTILNAGDRRLVLDGAFLWDVGLLPCALSPS